MLFCRVVVIRGAPWVADKATALGAHAGFQNDDRKSPWFGRLPIPKYGRGLVARSRSYRHDSRVPWRVKIRARTVRRFAC